MKWRALPKRHPPRDQGQSTGPFYVKIKILQIASHYSLGFSKFSPAIFSINCASDRNSEGTLCSSTFFSDFWGLFSAQNSNVFVQEKFVFIFENNKKITVFKSEKNSPGQIRWNFGLKTCPKNPKKKVEEHKVPSEFQSDAQFLR